MSNSDYYSRPDRYKAAIDIKPTPTPLPKRWTAIHTAFLLLAVGALIAAFTATTIVRAVLT